ncbi:MAG: hypothetical protein OCD76_02280 [Reichenbachiella sp.]
MKLKLTYLIALACMMSMNVDAQKLKVTSGSLKDMSAYKSYDLVYTYSDGLMIGKKTETDYLEEKRTAKNEKEAGTGDAWVAKWQEGKEGGIFFEKFEKLLNETLEESGVNGSRDNASADCTATVNVYYLDPGFNIGITRRPAFTSMTVTFAADGKEVAIVDMSKAPGADAMGYDFDAKSRIGESFAKSAKTLGKTLAKQAYK